MKLLNPSILFSMMILAFGSSFANAATLDCKGDADAGFDKLVATSSPKVLEIQSSGFEPVKLIVNEVRSTGSEDTLLGKVNADDGRVCAGSCPGSVFELKLSAKNDQATNARLTIKTRFFSVSAGTQEETQVFDLNCKYSGWTAISSQAKQFAPKTF